MSFERLRWLLLAALLSGGGCRDLVEPGSSRPDQLLIAELTVMRPDGLLTGDYDIYLYRDLGELGLLSLGRQELQVGGAGETRWFTVDAPGLYTLYFSAGNPIWSDFTVEAIELPGSHLLEAPYERVQGRAELPAGFPIAEMGGGSIYLNYTSVWPTGYPNFERITAPLQAGLEYVAWVQREEYRPELFLSNNASSYRVGMGEALDYPAGDFSILRFDLFPIDLEFSLRGVAAAEGLYELSVARTASEGAPFRFDADGTFDGEALRVWVSPGLREISVFSRDDRFMPVRFWTQVDGPATVARSLGRFEVTLICEDASATPLAGIAIQLRNAAGYLNAESDAAGTLRFATEPGRIELRVEGENHADLVVEGDLEMHLTVNP